ncbi:MAG TPA: hypothetical protein P5125_02860 [Kiritimatiellia bacterium]|nr:hypothetical protein [Kiritimatiellia bacterium]HPC48626.1 hypothetical protein [Kiritimatiellia bacterium]HPK36832.1 hypothetical protein [Kiritimatiellia bacterium]HRU19272.1 hypothetical protein [Kiritimatiellia bacterium]
MGVGFANGLITPRRRVPLAACFGRGGYGTLPLVGGAPREDTAERLIRAAGAGLRCACRA